ncbi:FecR family protein [Agriterribacter sp.]|uniref:FecR family protein n=1 Tax=Agriterribacter sp. TaxID=2821509 RepID=UPI002CD9D104|nr:FecR family protein [Agriterribacter sp.]HRP56449.1 FecR family protein [Agriterribacter sp.]
MDDRLTYLLVRKKSGEITLEEQLELSELLKNDYVKLILSEGIDEVFESHLSYGKSIPNNTVNGALDRLYKKIAETGPEPVHFNTNKYRRLKWWSVAASVLLVMSAAAFYLMTSPRPHSPSSNIITTQKGSKTNLVLPDGTKVWVNADTKLIYDKEFGNNAREVALTGEAYFDVVKDKTRPFIIHTSAVQVKVLGTTLNVRSYPTEKTTETTLIKGSVEVTLNTNPQKKVILKPNEKVVVENTDAVLPEQPVDTVNVRKQSAPMVINPVHFDKKDQEVYETMWVKNKLAFDETPFDKMIAELERWYNVQIIVKNKALSASTYTVTFENKSLDEALEGLQFSAHFQYQAKDGIVTIW